MKAMQHLTLASLLAFGSAFANVAIAEDISPVKPAADVQMTSQQELIDIFFAAAKTGNQEVINEFLKHGFPVDVRNAIAEMDFTEGPATMMQPGTIHWDGKGWNENVNAVIIQWQDGKPRTIFPREDSVVEIILPESK